MSTLLGPDIAAGCVRFEARPGVDGFDSIRVDDAKIEVVEMVSKSTVGKAAMVVVFRLSVGEQSQIGRCSRVEDWLGIICRAERKSDAWRVGLGGAAIIWVHGIRWMGALETGGREQGASTQWTASMCWAQHWKGTALGEGPLASAGVGEGCRDTAGVPARMGPWTRKPFGPQHLMQ